MPWPPSSLPSATVVTDATSQRGQHASDHNALATLANGMLATSWILINPQGGAAPAFINSWANYGAGWVLARFRKELGDVCRMEGFVANGPLTASGTFVLPLGYRPALVLRYIVPITASTGGGGAGYMDINTNGQVNIGPLSSGLSGTCTWAGIQASWAIDPSSL
jgi:hypothetical protein